MGLKELLGFGNKKNTRGNLQPEKKYRDDEYLKNLISWAHLTPPENLDLRNPEHLIELAVQLEKRTEGNVFEGQEFVTRTNPDDLGYLSEPLILQYQLVKNTISDPKELERLEKEFYATIGLVEGPPELRPAYKEFLDKLGEPKYIKLY